MKAYLFFLVLCIAALVLCMAAPSADIPLENFRQQEVPSREREPENLSILRRAYPDVSFVATYDDSVSDWQITVTVQDGNTSRSSVLYWCEGRMIPRDELGNRDNYRPFMYRYRRDVQDPATFTKEDIERIRQFSSPENRRGGASASQFFYDLLYDCSSRARVERHLVKVSFLGKQTTIHKRIADALKKVETEIRALARRNNEVKEFVDTLASADSYNWREIRDSGNRSFHSMGIAIDVLPRRWGSKNIYWAWRRDMDPDNWMLLPLEDRWMPPDEVIRIFERNGFIWGGSWMIWDNMHFEYRPEVILLGNSDVFSGR